MAFASIVRTPFRPDIGGCPDGHYAHPPMARVIGRTTMQRTGTKGGNMTATLEQRRPVVKPVVADARPVLKAEAVRKVYRSGADEVEALRGVDLSVSTGEFVAVMGPSGSGKTTLLNCFSGLDSIDGGRVLIEGKSIHELRDAERTAHRAAAMGFVFQAFNLIPVFTTVENVELPLLLAGAKEAEARRRAEETLARVGLGHRFRHRPTELSGGEQQRVAIARALAGKPRIVWADEPTGNLDSEMAGSVMELLEELHGEGLTLILVTHDSTVAARGTRLITVRDGRVVEDVAIERN
jgi:putative ABC transport system ATP-binding protein